MKKTERKEWAILYGAMIVSVLLIPTLKKKPSFTYWVGFLILNGIVNILLDQFLVEKKYLTYPVRLLAKQFTINLIYDNLICPYISVWNSQVSRKLKLPGILGSSLLFGVPQILFEIWAEKSTKLLKYKKLTFGKVSAIILCVKNGSRLLLIPYNKCYFWIAKRLSTFSAGQKGNLSIR